ncbi:3-hydroxyacyl-CoA dehydrogenase NAD-binding domain-containing protein [Pelagibacteraceae bacterium]|nr:3-hydroxyacyl-CoA dehydrogenase NAD-binding domain-containing protein [Pelagibacteraceae bacterium]
MNKIKNISVIGTGVIGTGWILRFLASNKKVIAFDKNKSQINYLKKEIKRTKSIVEKLYKKKININNLKIADTLDKAVKNSDLIQENVPERLQIKKTVLKKISKLAPKNTIIASSSSGLLPSKLQSGCINPQRFIIAHPFNPVYILPLVEIVKGNKTSKIYINKANSFYKSIKMKTLLINRELPGFLSDRLQEALWREGLHIINDGFGSTKDLDDAITYGPGMRWALMGTFLTFHLAGGESGMKHMLDQFGPALKLPWTKLKSPELNNKLKQKIINGTALQSKNLSIDKLSNIRDNFLIDLIELKKKYRL